MTIHRVAVRLLHRCQRLAFVVGGACLVLSAIALLAYNNYSTNVGSRLTISNYRWEQVLDKTMRPILSSLLDTERNSSVPASDPLRSIRPTVVCMIMTTPDTWNTRARAVLNTWAKRCPIPLFFYSRSVAPAGHPIIGATHAVPLDVPEGRGHLTGKTMAALRYSLQKYGDVADWFLKCDDDTYIVWENLLYIIGEYRGPSQVYLGRLIQNYIPHGYASGGAGYLISKPAVRRIVDEGSKFPADCPNDGDIEDYDLGRCLAKFGIHPSRTYGVDGRLRFHSDNPVRLIDGDAEHSKYYYFTWENVAIGNPKVKKTDHVMSSDTVSFHYVTPGQMYMFDFLLYRLNRHHNTTTSSPTTPTSNTSTGIVSTVSTTPPSNSTKSATNHTRRTQLLRPR